MPTSLPIAAVVLAYGSSGRHAGLVARLPEFGVLPERTIIVHNPDRLDQPTTVVAPDEMHVIRMPRNSGYSAAMNRGIELARTLDGVEAAVLLTHDVELAEDTLSGLHDAAIANPRFAVLGPALSQPAIRDHLLYGSYQTEQGSLGLIDTPPGPPGADVAEVPCVDGSIVYLRLAALDGPPLPNHYFMYFEEWYLCSSLARRGWPTGVVLRTVAESTPGGGSSRAVAYHYLYARNGLDWARRLGSVPHSGRRFARAELRRAVDDMRRGGRTKSALARLHGMVDQMRGRSGPPPAWVRRASDIRAV